MDNNTLKSRFVFGKLYYRGSYEFEKLSIEFDNNHKFKLFYLSIGVYEKNKTLLSFY